MFNYKIQRVYLQFYYITGVFSIIFPVNNGYGISTIVVLILHSSCGILLDML